MDQEEKKATVSVPEDQQSLAIGKEGQNARLANKLTKWKIDIKGVKGVFGADVAEKEKVSKSDNSVRGVWDEAIKKAEEAIERENAEKEEMKAEQVSEESENVEQPAE